MKRTRSLALLAAVVTAGTMFPTSDARSTVRLVPSQYPLIPDAVDASSPGDTVRVAPGVYWMGSVRVIPLPNGLNWTRFAVVFLKSGVVVESEAGPESTILDLRNQPGPSPATVVATGLAAGQAELRGFTVTSTPTGSRGLDIQRNYASVRVRVDNCIFRDLRGDPGAIYCEDTEIDVVNTTIRNNIATQSSTSSTSGIYFITRSSPSDSLRILGCSFIENSGFSIYTVFDPSVLIEDTKFLRNSTRYGAVDVGGHPIHLERCLFEENRTIGPNGASAIALRIASDATSGSGVFNCVFRKNWYSAGTASSVVELASPDMPIANCTFVENRCSSTGGVLKVHTGAPSTTSISNNIFYGSIGAPALRGSPSGGSLPVHCNCFYGNSAGNAVGIGTGTSALFVDPQFCSVLEGDFSLTSTSPCVPPNSGACGLIGAFDQGCTAIPHTIATVPPALAVHIDGIVSSAPVTPYWQIGAPHLLLADSIQALSYPNRYVFLRWENGSPNATRFVVAPGTSTTYTAEYFFQQSHAMTVTTSPLTGIPIEVDGVLDNSSPYHFNAGPGEVHHFTAFTPVLVPGNRYKFSSWENGETTLDRTAVMPNTNFTFVAQYVPDPYDTLLVASAPRSGLTVRIDGVDRLTPFRVLKDGPFTTSLFVPSPQQLPNETLTFTNWENGSTNPSRQFTQGDSSAVVTASFSVLTEGNVILDTNPPGQRVEADGVEYNAPANLIWEQGSAHVIRAFDTPELAGDKTRLQFTSWSDGGAIEHSVIAGAGTQTYVANYSKQYWLDLQTRGEGTILEAPGWYDEGASVTIHAAGFPRHVFDRWDGTGDGSYSGEANPAIVIMQEPLKEVATFVPATFEFALSLSAEDPFVDSGSPLGAGTISLWAVCTRDVGLSTVDLPLAAQGMQVLGVSPAPGIFSASTNSRIVLFAADCIEVPSVLATIIVYDPTGGGLCLQSLADSTVSPPPSVVDCNLGPPQAYFGYDFLRVRGVRTDGGVPCDVGNGCSVPTPLPPLLSGLRAVVEPSFVRLTWDASTTRSIDAFEVERSPSASESFEVLATLANSDSNPISFDDTGVAAGTSYSYRVRARSQGGEEIAGPLLVETLPAAPPSQTELLPPTPNPFRDRVEFVMSLATPSWARLSIHDVAGRVVKILADDSYSPGTLRFEWAGTNSNGNRVGDGVYFVRMETAGARSVRKVILRSGEK